MYVDDERHNLTAFKAAFRRDFNVFIAESAEEGINILQQNIIHVILSDQRMPKMTGIEFFESILPIFPDPIRILITGYTDINAVIDAINRQLSHYPYHVGQIVYIGKMIKSNNWKSLSIAKGKSDDFNELKKCER